MKTLATANNVSVFVSDVQWCGSCIHMHARHTDHDQHVGHPDIRSRYLSEVGATIQRDNLGGNAVVGNSVGCRSIDIPSVASPRAQATLTGWRTRIRTHTAHAHIHTRTRCHTSIHLWFKKETNYKTSNFATPQTGSNMSSRIRLSKRLWRTLYIATPCMCSIYNIHMPSFVSFSRPVAPPIG